jgi:N-dimethylarginine dimethylaminohydrolase
MGAAQIKRVLLCRPTHFTVDYIINPHMRPYRVDQPRAMHQWDELVKTLEGLKIKVEVIEQKPDVPDMVFATDQGIVKDGTVLLANFRYPQRAKERVYYRDWFRRHDFRLRALSNVFPFEGGDALLFGDKLLIGTGFRATTATCEELARKLNMDVVPLRLVDPYFYHLDMALLVIDEATAFYYPPAFSRNSQNRLMRIIPNLFLMSAEAANAYAANSFVSGQDIIVHSATPADFHKQLDAQGLRVHQVDVSEFIKAGGGIHCLINTLA